MHIKNVLLSGLLLVLTCNAIATELATLSSTETCSRCSGHLLPGSTQPHPKTKWGIISDLPESFSGYGVLYSTIDVLPDNGAPVAMRTQIKSADFHGIDDSFDVFLFHLLKSTTATARLVVYVKNNGSEAVNIRPKQVIKSEGTIGTSHEFESELARRVMAEEWDAAPLAVDSVSIPAGQGRVIARGKRFGNVTDEGPDASRNVNCFGYVRAMVESKTSPTLDVYVIAVPATPHEKIQAEAERLLTTGATSTDSVAMDSEPSGCAVRRAVGVYPNFIWRNDPITILASDLIRDGATTFPMALPEIQTAGCADARQTTDLALRPRYTRPDTIGNYMIEYEVNLAIENDTSLPVKVDVFFGKQEADIGLSYRAISAGQILNSKDPMPISAKYIATAWAGPKQSLYEKSLIPGDLVVPSQSLDTVYLRFMICGNSSLPFYLGVKQGNPVSANPD